MFCISTDPPLILIQINLYAFRHCQTKSFHVRTGHQQMSQVEVIDFHVAVLCRGAGEDWLVYRGPPSASVIVAFCGSRETATNRARTMAQYHCSIGKESRVVLHDGHEGSSRVVWSNDENRDQEKSS